MDRVDGTPDGRCVGEISLPRISVQEPCHPRQQARQLRDGTMAEGQSVLRQPEEPDREPRRWRSLLGKRQPGRHSSRPSASLQSCTRSPAMAPLRVVLYGTAYLLSPHATL